MDAQKCGTRGIRTTHRVKRASQLSQVWHEVSRKIGIGKISEMQYTFTHPLYFAM